MFYNRYLDLCRQKGVTPCRAAIEAGISKSLISKWKSNPIHEPSTQVIRKLADYFEVNASSLIDSDHSFAGNVERLLPDYLLGYLNDLVNRPELCDLLDRARALNEASINEVLEFIEIGNYN